MRSATGHMPFSRAPWIRYHLLTETSRERDTDETEAREDEGKTRPRHAPTDPAEVVDVYRPKPQHEATHREEQCTFHERMVEEVDDAAGQAGYGDEADAEDDITDLGDAGVCQHPLDVAL